MGEWIQYSLSYPAAPPFVTRQKPVPDVKSRAGFFFACRIRKTVLMDGEQDGAQAQGEERARQQGDPQAEDKQQGQKAPEQVGTPDNEEIRAALAE